MSEGHCELCVLEKRTAHYEENEWCSVVECDQCGLPMVVLRRHGMLITEEEGAAMEKCLEKVAVKEFGDREWYVDKLQKTIYDHAHWHARPGHLARLMKRLSAHKKQNETKPQVEKQYVPVGGVQPIARIVTRSERAYYPAMVPVTTRWADNDAYGHVNNAVYHFYFDTAVNSLLVKAGLLEIGRSPVYGVVAANACDYCRSVSFPSDLEVGVSVARVGSTSITYHLGVFERGVGDAVATGTFVHVYIDAATKSPTPIPKQVREYADAMRCCNGAALTPNAKL